MRVAIIIPVYNHATRVEAVIRAAQSLELPIFVVDDGSTDATPEVLRRQKGITALRHSKNRGKGAALCTGFAAAALTCDWAVSIDADGQHDPADAHMLLERVPAGKRVLVVGSRRGMTGKHVPWTSRFGRGFSNFWVWVSGGPRITDSQSGFRLYPLPETLHLNVHAQRYQFEVEVLVRARQLGLPILEAPVSVVYQPKGERISHFRPWRDFFRNSATFARLICGRILRRQQRQARPWSAYGHVLLSGIARLLGPWFFAGGARCIAALYFCFSSKVKESHRFYSALFPGHGPLFHRWCVFRQYQNFTTIHLDRFLLNLGRTPRFTYGDNEIPPSFPDQQGTLLLMSHLGNWEMAARLLMRHHGQVRLLLYMGVKDKEGVEGSQKNELRQAGVEIIGVDQGKTSPFAAIDGIHLLRAGGLVSMTGDVLWRTEQRYISVPFLGQTAHVPEIPFVLALVSGVPIHVFFAFRKGPLHYRIVFAGPIELPSSCSKAERDRVLTQAAAQYAALLEAALKKHPFEWYHFNRFLSSLPP